jgi:hypothetical protein
MVLAFAELVIACGRVRSAHVNSVQVETEGNLPSHGGRGGGEHGNGEKNQAWQSHLPAIVHLYGENRTCDSWYSTARRMALSDDPLHIAVQNQIRHAA